jgi:hypothetical protein
MRALWLAVLSILVVLAQGCSSLDDAPPSFAAAKSGGDGSGPFFTSCGVTKEDVAAVDFGSDPDLTLQTAYLQLQALREATKKVDAKLQEHLARVGPALEDHKVKRLVEAFEEHAKVVVKILRDDHYFDDVELPVKEIRTKYFDAVKRLAATLDAIGSSPERARYFASSGNLLTAYLELADSPCPARAIRFAGIILSLDHFPDSPYAAANNANSEDYAVAMIQIGLARALVERAVEHSEGPPADAPDKALAEVRGFLGNAAGVTDSVMSFLEDRETARLKALDPEFKADVKGHDLTPALRALNSVLFWWNISEAAVERDVGTLLKSSPAIAASAAEGIAALAEHFEATRVAGAATKVANAAGLIGKYVGYFFAAKGIIDTLDRLDDPGSNTGQLVAELVGQCMILAGSFMPPPLSYVVGGIGQIVVWVAGFLGDPPPDELAPLMAVLESEGELTKEERVAILEANAGNIWSLGRSMRLEPADVRWVLTTVRLSDDTNIARNEGLFGSPTMGLYRIHLESGLAGAAMAKYLRGIASSGGAAGRFELHNFVTYTASTHLFQGKSVKQALIERRTALVEYDVKYDAREVGLSASDALRLARAAWQRAIDGLPAANCPPESAARCSGDGRFVVWCIKSFLMTKDCWDDDKTCQKTEGGGASRCVDR